MTTPANAHVLDGLGDAHAMAAWLAGRQPETTVAFLRRSATPGLEAKR